MRLNDLKSLVKILLHSLVVDKMLLELLSQFCTQNLQIVNLFRCLIADLEDLFINVTTKEVGSLC